MRSAERPLRRLALLAALALGACAQAPERPDAAGAAGDTDRGTATVQRGPVAAPAGTLGRAGVADDQDIDPAVRKAFNDARLAMLTGHADRAEKAFLALTQSHPEYGGAYANLGIIYRGAGRLEDSARQLEEATRRGPRQPAYFNELGITYRMQGAFAKAGEAFGKAIEADPAYAAAVLNLAILNDIYLWQPDRALELYQKFLVLAPDSDDRVPKWIADLKNRQRAAAKARKEQP